MDVPPEDEHRLADDFVAQRKLAEKRGIKAIVRYAAIFGVVVLFGALTGILTESTAGTIITMVFVGIVCWFVNLGPSRRERNAVVYFGVLNEKPTDYRALMVQRPPEEGAYRSAAPPEEEQAGVDGSPPITKWTD